MGIVADPTQTTTNATALGVEPWGTKHAPPQNKSNYIAHWTVTYHSPDNNHFQSILSDVDESRKSDGVYCTVLVSTS